MPVGILNWLNNRFTQCTVSFPVSEVTRIHIQGTLTANTEDDLPLSSPTQETEAKLVNQECGYI